MSLSKQRIVDVPVSANLPVAYRAFIFIVSVNGLMMALY
jgi:hypothetical protein